jgi:hypothetical protein
VKKNRQNILLVSYSFPPKAGVGSLRPFYMAYYLQKLGHKVSVLTPYVKDVDFWASTYFAEKIKESGVKVYYSGYFNWYEVLKTQIRKNLLFKGKKADNIDNIGKKFLESAKISNHRGKENNKFLQKIR